MWTRGPSTMVPRQDFATIVQLTEKAEEYETFQSSRQSPPPSLALVPETAYHRSKNSEKSVVLQLLNRWRNRDKTAAMKWSNRGHHKTRVLVSLVCNRNRAYQRRTPHLNNTNKRRIVSWNCDYEEHLFTDCPKPKVLVQGASFGNGKALQRLNVGAVQDTEVGFRDKRVL